MDYDYWITDPESVTKDDVSIDYKTSRMEIKTPMLDVVLYSYVKLMWIKKEKMMFPFPFQINIGENDECLMTIKKPWGIMGSHLLIQTKLQRKDNEIQADS